MKIDKIIDKTEMIAGVFCILYYFICAITVGSRISILFIWLLMGIVLITRGILGCWNRGRAHKGLKAVQRIFDILLLLFLVSVMVFFSFILRSMHEKGEKNCDYIIVLGASVYGTEPSSVLQKRIDAAYDYLKENKDTFVVATGGQGPGEDISEGKCIADELEKRGISKDRILVEEKSTTTVENFKYALEKIPKEIDSIAIVSNGFHIFRAKFILSSYSDVRVSGIAAGGGGILIPHYMLREYLAFVVDFLCGNYQR